MCVNYIPIRKDHWLDYFAHLEATYEYMAESWPGYDAPIMLPGYEPVRATFGMVPVFAQDESYIRKYSTYNARSESITSKVTFKNAWRSRRLCLVPAESIFEPNYESGKPVRWSIFRKDRKPFCIAGLWDTRKVDGLHKRSFTMLTINADDHPLMKRFHAPSDEKRSVVILPPENYDRWLQAHDQDDDELREMLVHFDASEFDAEPAPLPSRKKKAADLLDE